MKWKYLFLSVRYKPLLMGVGPVLVGCVLSFSSWSGFSFLLNGLIIFCVLCIQTATHFFNDALDFIKGADSPARKGPHRPAQKGWLAPALLFKAGGACLLMAGVAGMYLVWRGGPVVFIIGVFSLALAYLYTGGLRPLAYTGLADLFVLLFFGLIPSSVVFYLNTGYWSGTSFIAGLQCGLLALSLLTVNNLRDRELDSLANKKTLIVRWGLRFGAVEWTLAHLLPCLPCVYYGIFKPGALVYLLPLALLPFSAYMCFLLRDCLKNKKPYEKLFACTLLHYLLFVLLLCAGFIF